MYIETSVTYYVGGEQRCLRRLFFLMVQGKGPEREKIKCCVRQVALRQVGNFMMGYARIYGHILSVSGAYGHDGLPMTVPDEVYDRLKVYLPYDLFNAWNKGEGWNCAGAEANAIRTWALKNEQQLRS